MEFTKISELAAAKKHLRERGYTVESLNTLVGGRKGFRVTGNGHVYTICDYDVLALATHGEDAFGDDNNA